MNTRRYLALTAALTVSAAASVASAAPSLVVDTSTGNIQLVDTAASPVAFSAYEVGSTGGGLLPGEFRSLASQGVPTFSSVAPSTANLTEFDSDGVFTTTAAGTGFSLGNAYNTTLNTLDLTLSYGDADGNELTGSVSYVPVAPIPEPTSLALLGLGGLGLLARRRRA